MKDIFIHPLNMLIIKDLILYNQFSVQTLGSYLKPHVVEAVVS